MSPVPGPRHGVALGLTAVAYNLCHHLGSLPDGLGDAGRGTRVGDWLDLLVPLLVLTPALLTLLAARADRTSYVLFGVGAWLYVSGHGIHLAANSIWNVDPSPTAELWDEYVGHWLWYAGVVVVAAALARTMLGRRRPTQPVAWALALATGATWATNAVGGHFTMRRTGRRCGRSRRGAGASGGRRAPCGSPWARRPFPCWSEPRRSAGTSTDGPRLHSPRASANT